MSTISIPHGWTQRFFVFGHLAKGVVYGLIGGIALAAVIGEASNPGGMKDVIQSLQNQPFGQVLLGLMAVGLFSYCAWRWIKAIKDLSHDGDDAKGLAKRAGYAASGSAYGFLGIFTISLIQTGSGSDSSKQDMLAQILAEPWGQIVVGLLAAIILGVGIYQFYKGIKEKYMQEVGHTHMTPKEQKTYRRLGKAGHIARSVIYAIIAYFLFRVAVQSDASEYRGIGGALDYLSSQTMGIILVSLVGIGLVLYGLFMMVKAKYPRLT